MSVLSAGTNAIYSNIRSLLDGTGCKVSCDLNGGCRVCPGFWLLGILILGVLVQRWFFKDKLPAYRDAEPLIDPVEVSLDTSVTPNPTQPD